MAVEPRWTIAVPTYRGALYLAETLRSALAQTDPDFELIVCDDGSTDDTQAIVRDVCGERATVYPNDTGRAFGLAGNWNRCVDKASGEWVTILHQDDLLAPDFLREHRRNAVACPDAGLILGPVRMIDAQGRTIPESGNDQELGTFEPAVYEAGEFCRLIVDSNRVRCPGTSLRRDAHQRLGGFDGSWKYVVDWDFWARSARAERVVVIDQVLASQRWHSGSETQRLARGTVDLEENARLMRRILAETIPDDDKNHYESAVRERMARAWLNRAYEAARRGDRSIEKLALKNALGESSRIVIRALMRQPRTLIRLILGKVGMNHRTAK